jgi:hypothetical protein
LNAQIDTGQLQREITGCTWSSATARNEAELEATIRFIRKLVKL